MAPPPRHGGAQFGQPPGEGMGIEKNTVDVKKQKIFAARLCRADIQLSTPSGGAAQNPQGEGLVRRGSREQPEGLILGSSVAANHLETTPLLSGQGREQGGHHLLLVKQGDDDG